MRLELVELRVLLPMPDPGHNLVLRMNGKRLASEGLRPEGDVAVVKRTIVAKGIGVRVVAEQFAILDRPMCVAVAGPRLQVPFIHRMGEEPEVVAGPAVHVESRPG